mgnify:CR=1 FL=1|tara:strand:- start:213 stop:503 length:291 start_codon:yes stop_codon:yes gene_type:complete
MENTRIYEALLAKCKAERLEALATLDVYMSNPVGIGEHPQIVEEAMKQLEKLANADGMIDALQGQYDSKSKKSNSSEIKELSEKIEKFIKQLTQGN